MNPIYRFYLGYSGTDYLAYPIYRDELAIDFERESGQQFFRRKLSGELIFEKTDYQRIVNAAFETQFYITILISYNAGSSWTPYWSGTFWKTDCEFDADSQTVKVKPTVRDNYMDILAGLEKEYNLIELTPEIVPIKADKRPMIQVYVPGQSVVGCFLSGMWWEQECEIVNENDTVIVDNEEINKLRQYLHFYRSLQKRAVEVSGTFTPADIPPVFITAQYATFAGYEINVYYDSNGYRFRYHYTPETQGDDPQPQIAEWSIERISDGVVLFYGGLQGTDVPLDLPQTITLNAVSGSGATGSINLYIYDINVYARLVCDVQQVGPYPTDELPSDDMVMDNRNYHYVLAYDASNDLYLSSNLTTTPTQWGIYQPGQYYQPPYVIGTPEMFPVARNAWSLISTWFSFSNFSWVTEERARAPFAIKDAYPLASVISVLLAKIAPALSFAATTAYSQFLYGSTSLGSLPTLFITPKSNIISSGYDQPAQQAPITLKMVLDMLRDCYRCYWFIDSENRLRIEHIRYFMLGGAYSGTPVVGNDLTAQIVTRNGKPWAFARDKYQFDKPEMAARYQFGWMDEVTQLFQGYPIDIISKYVEPGRIEQITVANFTSDIDYILLNPGDISKDGFVLLGANYGDSVSSFTGVTAGNNFSDTQRVHIPANMSFVLRMECAAGMLENGYVYLDINGTQIRTMQRNRDYTFLLDYPVYELKIRRAGSGILSSGTITFTITPQYYELPYGRFTINNGIHVLQNSAMAFIVLQDFYRYDMPAKQYSINGVSYVAIGIKKLKNQTVRFPALNDPDVLQLIKTNLGNGAIEKLSLNLSSRTANATLKYDTE